MNQALVKEALTQLANNWQLRAPNLRRAKPVAAKKTLPSFGFSVPVQGPPKPQPKTTDYYFGNPRAMPAGNYRSIRTNGRDYIPGVRQTPAQLYRSLPSILPKQTTRSGTGSLADFKPIDYFSRYNGKGEK